MVHTYDIFRLLALLLWYSCFSSDVCFAERDSNANTYGYFTNPNVVAFSHYWADAKNVYEDLSSFKKLYVKFHHCAWSSQSYQNDGNTNQNTMACGLSTAQNEDYWWMGMQPCTGANVAFSLYGILTTETTFLPQQYHCSKGRYINSFYTTDGLQTFVALMGLNSSSSSYYSDDFTSQMGCTINDKGTGIALGCSIHGAFTLNKFNGSCYKNNYLSTISLLDGLNQDLIDRMDCFLVYSSDGSVDYVTDLLSKSSACQLGLDKNCPDPYGILRMYENNLIDTEWKNRYYEKQRIEEKKFVCFLTLISVGIALVILRIREMRKLHHRCKYFRYENKYMENDDELEDTYDQCSMSVDTSVAYAVYI